jgi:hypothetical protein
MILRLECHGQYHGECHGDFEILAKDSKVQSPL